MDDYQKICYCKQCRGVVHRIAAGDTLYALSRKYNVAIEAIMDANPYINIYNLKIGEEICIPTVVRPQPRNNMNIFEEE